MTGPGLPFEREIFLAGKILACVATLNAGGSIGPCLLLLQDVARELQGHHRELHVAADGDEPYAWDDDQCLRSE